MPLDGQIHGRNIGGMSACGCCIGRPNGVPYLPVAEVVRTDIMQNSKESKEIFSRTIFIRVMLDVPETLCLFRSYESIAFIRIDSGMCIRFEPGRDRITKVVRGTPKSVDLLFYIGSKYCNLCGIDLLA